MPREIRSIIELNQRQTKEFLASLNDRSNEKARRKTIAEAMKIKFTVIE